MEFAPRFVDLDGVRAHYVTAGDGQPLVLLPGLGSSVRCSWGALLPHLARDFRVFALDLPGQGDSDKPARDYSLGFAVESTRLFIDSLGLGAVHLMGTSAGGLVSLSTALAHPDRVSRLALVAPAGLGAQVNWGLRLAAVPYLGPLGLSPWRWLIRRSLHWNFADPSCINDELVEEYRRVRGLPGARAALACAMRNALSLRGLRPDHVLCDRLGELQQPSLVIWGRSDRVLPVAHAEVARRLIPDCTVRILENAGHDPSTEHPAEVARLVREFLNREQEPVDV